MLPAGGERRKGIQLRDAEVQLPAQRLRELMLWHGKDEGNLPPAATLANLSRDTIAALGQLQLRQAQVSELRIALAQIFWERCGLESKIAFGGIVGRGEHGMRVVVDRGRGGDDARDGGVNIPTDIA